MQTSDKKAKVLTELENIKWAYQLDDDGIKDFPNPKGRVVGKTVVKKVIVGNDMWDNKRAAIYAYLNDKEEEGKLKVKIKTIALPIYLDRYKEKGKKAPNSLADDLHYGDGKNMDTGHSLYTISEIKNLSILFNIQLNQDDKTLWSVFSDMVTSLFSIGELEKVALKMIARFKSNIGGEFSDPILKKHVENHESTQRFCKSMDNLIEERLKQSNGNPEGLEGNITHWEDKKWGHPRFSTLKDTFAGGLTICMNDTWAHEVIITDLKIAENEYEAKYKVILYDHFGLDKPDVEKKYVYGAGFRAWFVLQHVRNYKPFITKVEFVRDTYGTF